MTFDEILEQVLALLKRQGRVSYPALKIRYIWKRTFLRRSKLNSSTFIRLLMTKAGGSSGLATLNVHTKSPLPLLRQHDSLLLRNSHPLMLNLSLLPLLFVTRKDDN